MTRQAPAEEVVISFTHGVRLSVRPENKNKLQHYMEPGESFNSPDLLVFFWDLPSGSLMTLVFFASSSFLTLVALQGGVQYAVYHDPNPRGQSSHSHYRREKYIFGWRRRRISSQVRKIERQVLSRTMIHSASPQSRRAVIAARFWSCGTDGQSVWK